MRKILTITLFLTVCGCLAKGQTVIERARSFSREENYTMAKQLYIQCHKEGNRDCTIEYALLLLNGYLLEESPDQIFGLIEPLANQDNDAEAQYLLGVLYLDGRGVPKDCGKAIFWFDRAINNVAATARVRANARKEKMDAENCYVPPKPLKSGHFFVLPGISFGSMTSFTAMAGYAKNNIGGYLKFKSSFSSKDKIVVSGSKDDYFYDDNKFRGRFSFYGGLLWRLSEKVYLNTGVGFGNKWEQWETMDGSKVEISEVSFSGFDPEIGLLFRFGNFSFGGGLNCLIGNGNSAVEGNISIGLAF